MLELNDEQRQEVQKLTSMASEAEKELFEMGLYTPEEKAEFAQIVKQHKQIYEGMTTAKQSTMHKLLNS